MGGSGRGSGSSRAGFHISTDPARDMCAECVTRMEAFGADRAEITKQARAILRKAGDAHLRNFGACRAWVSVSREWSRVAMTFVCVARS